MTTPRLRPMTPADIEPAVDAILAEDWGDRRAWFEFAVAHPACRVVVAEDDAGSIVGTGVATINGPVGWIGTIWVARAARRRGLGQALTEATIEAAESVGCRTLVLVATDAGRPLYERLGFSVQTWYLTVEAPGLATAAGMEAHLRPAISVSGCRSRQARPCTEQDASQSMAQQSCRRKRDRWGIVRASWRVDAYP